MELGGGQDGTGRYTLTWVPPAPAPQRSPEEQPGLLTHLCPSPWGGVT